MHDIYRLLLVKLMAGTPWIQYALKINCSVSQSRDNESVDEESSIQTPCRYGRSTYSSEPGSSQEKIDQRRKVTYQYYGRLMPLARVHSTIGLSGSFSGFHNVRKVDASGNAIIEVCYE
jgi:hypothetical protein